MHALPYNTRPTDFLSKWNANFVWNSGSYGVCNHIIEMMERFSMKGDCIDANRFFTCIEIQFELK